MVSIAIKKISNRLLLSYSIPLVCLAGLGFVTYGVARQVVEISDLDHTIKLAEDAANDASYHLIDAARRVKGYMLRPGNSTYPQRYRESYEQYNTSIGELTALATQLEDEEASNACD